MNHRVKLYAGEDGEIDLHLPGTRLQRHARAPLSIGVAGVRGSYKSTQQAAARSFAGSREERRDKWKEGQIVHAAQISLGTSGGAAELWKLSLRAARCDPIRRGPVHRMHTSLGPSCPLETLHTNDLSRRSKLIPWRTAVTLAVSHSLTLMVLMPDLA